MILCLVSCDPKAKPPPPISRENAEIAKKSLHNTDIDGSLIDIHWAKPVDKEAYTAYLNKKSSDKQQKLNRNLQNQLQMTNAAYLPAYPAAFYQPGIGAAYAQQYILPTMIQQQSDNHNNGHNNGQDQNGNVAANAAANIVTNNVAAATINPGSATASMHTVNPTELNSNLIYDQQTQRYLQYAWSPLAAAQVQLNAAGLAQVNTKLASNSNENNNNGNNGSNNKDGNNKDSQKSKRGAGGIRACGTRKYLNKGLKGNSQENLNAGASNGQNNQENNNNQVNNQAQASTAYTAAFPQLQPQLLTMAPRFIPRGQAGLQNFHMANMVNINPYGELLAAQNAAQVVANANAGNSDMKNDNGNGNSNESETLKRLPNTTTSDKKPSYMLSENNTTTIPTLTYDQSGLATFATPMVNIQPTDLSGQVIQPTHGVLPTVVPTIPAFYNYAWPQQIAAASINGHGNNQGNNMNNQGQNNHQANGQVGQTQQQAQNNGTTSISSPGSNDMSIGNDNFLGGSSFLTSDSLMQNGCQE